MMYASFDAQGRATAFWAPFQTDRPPDAVSITDAQWRELMAHGDARRWDGTTLVEWAPDPADALAAWRAEASLSRRAFLQAAHDAGYIDAATRLEAAQGRWPSALAGALSGMSDSERTAAEIEWAETPRVRRDHPLMALVAVHLGLSDAEVDALFGWTG